VSRKTTPRVTTSSALDSTYWRTASHTFTPAHWGPKYCVLCNATRSGEGVVHVQPHRLPFNDPRHFGSYPSPVERLETWWKVEAWNTTKGGSCTYDVQPSYEAAVAQAQALIENGDWKGVTYEHYAVAEMVREVVVTTFHHPIPDPA
jgi:hypothetical protein